MKSNGSNFVPSENWLTISSASTGLFLSWRVKLIASNVGNLFNGAEMYEVKSLLLSELSVSRVPYISNIHVIPHIRNSIGLPV